MTGAAQVSASRISTTSTSAPISTTSERRYSFAQIPGFAGFTSELEASGPEAIEGQQAYRYSGRQVPLLRKQKLKAIRESDACEAGFRFEDNSNWYGEASDSVCHCTSSVRRVQEAFLPQRYKRRDKHFHALKSWAMYQHVVQRVSFQSLEGMFKECFDLSVSYQEFHMIKSLMATRYQATYRSILQKIVCGEVDSH